jgi:hypothetical protein
MVAKPQMFNGVFMGLDGPGINIRYDLAPRYPFWLYKDDCEPVMVHNEDEEQALRADGYDTVTASILSNRYLINWFWDLEDMSPKQLVAFAQDEYGIDLPLEAGQDRLFKAVVELSKHAPQNRNRLILMAHTVKMKYEETMEEIRRMVLRPSPDMVTENISCEFEA